MEFDDRTRELARAHDAVDRLRDVQQRMVDRQARTERIHDLTVRGILLVLIAVVLVQAYMRL